MDQGETEYPKKYLPILQELFMWTRLTLTKSLRRLKTGNSKEKLKFELQPIIKEHKQILEEGASKLKEVPVYDQEEINKIERSIEKAKIVQRFKESLETVDEHPFMDTYRIIIELLEQAGTEIIFHKTLQGLAHYLNVLPGDISTGAEQEEFESALFEVLDDHNY